MKSNEHQSSFINDEFSSSIASPSFPLEPNRLESNSLIQTKSHQSLCTSTSWQYSWHHSFSDCRRMHGVTGMMQWESNMVLGAHTHIHEGILRSSIRVTLLCITLIGVKWHCIVTPLLCAAEDARLRAWLRTCTQIWLHSSLHHPSINACLHACMHLESHQPWASLRYEWSRAACCKGPALYSEDHNAALSSWQVHLASKLVTPSNCIGPKYFDIVGPKFQRQLRVLRCNDLWVDRLETLHGSGKHPDAKRAMRILGPLLS